MPPVPGRDSHLYKRVLGQSLGSAGTRNDGPTLHRVPPRSAGDSLSPVSGSVDPRQPTVHISSPTNEDNAHLAHGVAEVAAIAAVQDSQRHNGRKPLTVPKPTYHTMPSVIMDDEIPVGADAAGGHDAPNWSRTKSSIILLGATVLYAIIAEILVNTVDVVLENFDIDEKFLGFTLFALVPNTTEFLVTAAFQCAGNRY